ncbi:MAG TPA: hypothetical protein DCR93_28465 [Cytophagales bacterium]|nr:hypothetical protein [Cytophagales bacterium]HAP63269.1 hypothetical protein [Cytophagales bacterium]
MYLLVGFAPIMAHGQTADPLSTTCDSAQAANHLLSPEYLHLPAFDHSHFTTDSFYSLPLAANRRLWFREIEHPDSTRFTPHWWDRPESYHADQLDFAQHYWLDSTVRLAMQFGPNEDLWAYNIFIVKEVAGCLVVSRSYFRHARFTYKAYALITEPQLLALRQQLGYFAHHRLRPVNTQEHYAIIADHQCPAPYYLDVGAALQERGTLPHRVMLDLFAFLGEELPWVTTYLH